MPCPIRCAAVKAAAALLLAAGSGLAFAQAWPSKPIRMVIPYPPGGPTDILGRIVAQQLEARLGQSVVVDNKPGASGMIGADIVAKAAPDGNTLLVNASIHAITIPACTRSRPTTRSAISRPWA